MAELVHDRILDILFKGEISLEGEFLHGSNYTFLTNVIPELGEKLQAVYKPLEGERILWDFPDNTLAHRETAAFLVSQALGWRFIPPTVFRNDGPFGPGSVQLFIDHNPNYHYFTFSDDDFIRLKPVVLFDLLINNADRKGSHIIFDDDGHLWLIDHGLSFNVEEKLRTVIWDFAGQPIPENIHTDLVIFHRKLESNPKLVKTLSKHLEPDEIEALKFRAKNLIEMEHMPFPPNDRRAYPFPPV